MKFGYILNTKEIVFLNRGFVTIDISFVHDIRRLSLAFSSFVGLLVVTMKGTHLLTARRSDTLDLILLDYIYTLLTLD